MLRYEVLKRHRLTLDHATFLMSTELDKRPFTLNHYFNGNLQHAQNRRKVEELRNKTRTAFTVKNGVYPQSGKQQSFSNLTLVHYSKFKDVQRMPFPRQQLGLMTEPSSDEEKAKKVEPQPQRPVAQRRPRDEVMNARRGSSRWSGILAYHQRMWITLSGLFLGILTHS